ncbi:hypothetical protein M4951_20790 [Blastopirellula sp. J2-11]|uniref:hypothetical protein n=1 Tax=Blastopirellula sp. J2-11 TaxID=2943192 RepID=UPI0021C646D1|nr:hypothetical protein [Blastopirellula sp. J2-11]UUO05795.1 hypothetical protein M4951_20790 [Blastopirellula sp. J2-11]
MPQVDGDFWRGADSAWRDPQTNQLQPSSLWLNIAVPAAATLVAMLVLATYWGSVGPSSSNVVNGRSLANAQLEAERYLVNLSLPAVCLTQKPARTSEMVVQAVASLDVSPLAHLTCCSECHHRSGDQQPAPATSSPAAIVAAANSCQACHAP